MIILAALFLAGTIRPITAAACPPLSVGTATFTFDNCEPINSFLTLYYTLEPSGTAKTLFKGGLKQTAVSGWGAWAISPSGSMIGAQSVIVYPDSSAPSGASVTGIVLPSYQASAINAAKGSWPLTDTSAAKNADGSLSAVFSVELDQSVADLAGSPLTTLYVSNGGMAASGDLATHTTRTAEYNGQDMVLKASTTTTTASPSPVASPSPSPSPVASPSPSPVVATSPSPVVATSPSPEAVPSPSHVVAPITTAPSPSLSTDAAAAPSTASDSTCSLSISNAVQSYRACYSVAVSTGIQVFYSIDADPNDATSSILSMALMGSSTGYISVGFPSKPGRMSGSTAAILQVCATCPSGASIKEHYMSGTSISSVVPDTRMGLSDLKASAVNGVLSGSWTMTLPGVSVAASRRRRLTAFTATLFPLIYASGPVSSTGMLMTHPRQNSAAGNVDLLHGSATGSSSTSGGGGGGDGSISGDGSTSEGDVVQASSDGASWKNAHTIIATISWGVMIPLGIFSARYFKPHTKYWFNIHRIVNSLAYVLALVTLGLGFKANGGWETDVPVHRTLGITCTALGLVQMTALINALRPTLDHKMRGVWFLVHAWIGRSAAIIAIANIYYGFLKVGEIGAWAWIVYSVFLGCIVAAGVVMEVINHRLRVTSANEKHNMNRFPSRPNWATNSSNSGSSGDIDGGDIELVR